MASMAVATPIITFLTLVPEAGMCAQAALACRALQLTPGACSPAAPEDRSP